MKGIEQYFVACEQAHLVCNSREYLGGGSRRVKPREEWTSAAKILARITH